jgi:predicted RNase H-like HicB family nuclease
MKLRALIHAAEEGGYWAEVPALRGCITEGDTWDEVILNLQEAIEGWLAVADECLDGKGSSEVVEITV